MLARAHTFTIEDYQTRHVSVEVDIRPGLPGFTIVGLADAAVREARERVQAAIINSGYEFPSKRITANLAPGDVPKVGPGLDLALACAVLAASKQLPHESLESLSLIHIFAGCVLRSSLVDLLTSSGRNATQRPIVALCPVRELGFSRDDLQHPSRAQRVPGSREHRRSAGRDRAQAGRTAARRDARRSHARRLALEDVYKRQVQHSPCLMDALRDGFGVADRELLACALETPIERVLADYADRGGGGDHRR